MSKFDTHKLKGKIHVKHGFPFRSEFFKEEGRYVVLTPGNFYEEGGFKRNSEKDKCYSEPFPEEYLLKQGDIVVAMTEQSVGLLGSMAKVPENNKFLHNQRLGLVTALDSSIELDFIYHQFKTNYVRRQIQLTSTGSKVKHTAPERIYNLSMLLPSPKEQSRIAKLLSTIDKKIELNNRINAELEAMAKTLYDYWFVQFDFPDANGKPYKTSGGKMVYNLTLKREIPEGWKDGSLWDIARYFNGLAMQKYRPEGTEFLPVIKIKEMGEGVSEKSEKASPNIPADAILNDGDVLFSWSATLDVKIWSQGKGALNQHIFKVTSETYPKTFYYFELLNYLNHFKMMAEKRKTTMGHITQDHLKQSRICIPPTDLLYRVHEKIEPIFKKHLLHEQENQHLTQLRDWLLPMLMNGQVTVK